MLPDTYDVKHITTAFAGRCHCVLIVVERRSSRPPAVQSYMLYLHFDTLQTLKTFVLCVHDAAAAEPTHDRCQVY